MNIRRILVTGAGGVLGSAMRESAGEHPALDFTFVTSRDADLRDAGECARLFRSLRPDAVIHLAAVSGGVTFSQAHPATNLRDNILMTFAVLDAARDGSVGKVVMTLSSGMYPPAAAVPYREEQIHDGPAHESNFGYAYAKRIIEPAIRAYRSEHGVNAIGLVPNGIFGEHDTYDGDSTTFIAALIRRFYEARTGRDPIVVWGDGTPLRELTYAPDMARAFVWALRHYDGPDVLNVGTPEEHSIAAIAAMIADELGIDPARIVFDHSKPGGVYRKTADTSRFIAASGFRFTPLREGLRRTIRWFAANHEGAIAGHTALASPPSA